MDKEFQTENFTLKEFGYNEFHGLMEKRPVKQKKPAFIWSPNYYWVSFLLWSSNKESGEICSKKKCTAVNDRLKWIDEAAALNAASLGINSIVSSANPIFSFSWLAFFR